MKLQLIKTIQSTGLAALAVAIALGATDAEAAKKRSAKKPAAKSSSRSRPAPAAPVFPSSPAPEAEAQDVEVGQIKERYWTRGDENEVGVVQNRIYSKARRLEVGAFGGLLGSDPFLTVKSAGGSLGYHFNEYWALHLVGWKAFASPSSALIKFQETRAATTLTNEPNWYLGGEVAASVLYGKLSLVGKSIIYYDLHLLGGAGLTDTKTGKYVTPHIGIGQQVYLTEAMSIKLDYRLMAYREQIIETEVPSRLGELIEERLNWTNAVTLGVSFLIGRN